MDEAENMRKDTHQMVADMHAALMEPPAFDPNQKSLVARMADVTVEIESGKRTAENVLSIAKWLVAVAAAVAVLAAVLKIGHWPNKE
jgi:hypothetical protein